jgi:uncharacterized membrane protein YuzA (DUF378 family)
MLAFISFILVCIGCLNWFCIGILQYDFVAGIFGSQSNIFSRLIYTLVGVASIIVIVNFVTNKGKFVVSFKRAGKEYKDYMEDKKEEKRSKLIKANESAEDYAPHQQHLHNKEYYGLESAEDHALEESLGVNAEEHYGLESAEDFGLNEQKSDKTSLDDKHLKSKHKD